jgi:hypothetical protein
MSDQIERALFNLTGHVEAVRATTCLAQPMPQQKEVEVEAKAIEAVAIEAKAVEAKAVEAVAIEDKRSK